jgi:N-glycosylase/DNA lyase
MEGQEAAGVSIRIDQSQLSALMLRYREVEAKIWERLSEFRRFDREDCEGLFRELVFCLLTPQTSARRADLAVRELEGRGLLLRGSIKKVSEVLRRCGVRFHNRKAVYIVLNRRRLGGEGVRRMLVGEALEAREVLVRRVLGFGYKEASHFLRNIGYTGLAILDRHILRGMVRLGVLAEIPKIGSRRAYLGVEKIFIDAARVIGIEPEALDLLLWYEATGEVFK